MFENFRLLFRPQVRGLGVGGQKFDFFSRRLGHICDSSLESPDAGESKNTPHEGVWTKGQKVMAKCLARPKI